MDEDYIVEHFGELLLRAAQEALAFERGEDVPARVVTVTARDVGAAPLPTYDAERIRAIRHRLGFSQTVFADTLGVSVSTVRAWEQGKRRHLYGPTRRLLELAERRPSAYKRLYLVAGKQPLTSRGKRLLIRAPKCRRLRQSTTVEPAVEAKLAGSADATTDRQDA